MLIVGSEVEVDSEVDVESGAKSNQNKLLISVPRSGVLDDVSTT
jgi:hypothetical protein